VIIISTPEIFWSEQYYLSNAQFYSVGNVLVNFSKTFLVTCSGYLLKPMLRF
jgi:hypothetical protein